MMRHKINRAERAHAELAAEAERTGFVVKVEHVGGRWEARVPGGDGPLVGHSRREVEEYAAAALRRRYPPVAARYTYGRGMRPGPTPEEDAREERELRAGRLVGAVFAAIVAGTAIAALVQSASTPDGPSGVIVQRGAPPAANDAIATAGR